MSKIDLKACCEKLAYQFNDMQLLEKALTHRSVSAVHNERLEFLGDAILNFVIADIIYAKFPKAKEGELSRLRADLVCGETLAEIGKKISLGDYLYLAQGEIKSGGRQRVSILANAVEAIIASVYLDSGLQACQKFVQQLFFERLAKVSVSTILKDSKTQLQEYLQAKKMSLPNYTVIESGGDAHHPFFKIECRVAEIDYLSRGVGSSKRRAEQQAAAAFIEFLQANES